MQSPPRVKLLQSTCREVRENVGENPRHDAVAKAQTLALLAQLRRDPYSSQYAHRCIAAVINAIEEWFSEDAPALAPRKVIELRETVQHQLAQLETEQHLRTWLMETYR